MEMVGQKLIPETRETVWKALNDPEILRNCVPGCQTLVKTSDTEMEATATIKVGPVSAKFRGNISLSELNEPVSYRITGEGQGGVAGFAKGGANISLEEVEGGTMLCYTVDAQVGGKLAQLGGRLIDATARKLSEAFFEKFASEIRRQYHGDDAAAPSVAGAATAASGVGPTGAAPAVMAAIPGGRAAAMAGPGWYPPPYPYAPPLPPEPAGGSRTALLAALALACVFAFLWLTGRQGTIPASTTPPASGLSPEFGAALQLILIAAVGYLFGRLSDRRP
jgi:carbon monoxide dehydrogenase subunit G